MLIAVALPLPLARAFTYRVPAALAPRAVPGARVVVPIRGRTAVGICLGPALEVPPVGGLRDVVAIPEEPPALTSSLLATGAWVARHYGAAPGLAYRAMLPALLLGAHRADPAGRQRRVARIARALPSLAERDRAFARAPRQRELYERLEAMGGSADATALLAAARADRGALAALVRRGVVAIERTRRVRDPFAARGGGDAPPLEPTPAQQAAIAAIAATPAGGAVLVHGVTGSGKTLVYLEALRDVVVRRGRGAIVLVPEIALTPQTVDRFRAVFGDLVAVLHSALSDGERLDAWRALRAGDRRVAIGARSAVFAPLPDVGIIVVDEEHEATYKQGEAPRYHARDVALVRARHEGAVVVLGSATPSLESWHAAAQGRATLVTLPERVGGRPLPPVQVIDRRAAPPPGAPPALRARRAVLSAELEEALAARLAAGEQALLLLNRRGFASWMACRACEAVRECPRCAVALTFHRAPDRLVCHYCGTEDRQVTRCTACGDETLARRGVGTQQVEAVVAERFPTARIARMDVDTTAGKWAHTAILDRVAAREVDILLGTQMIAKGLDFPAVTLVGVVDADVGINLPDFRASERCFQLLAQVAGRTGRGPLGGEVLIQTRVPSHHAVRCAVTHDYRGFVAEELAHRASPAYPPFARLLHAVVSGPVEAAVVAAAADAAAWTRAAIAAAAWPLEVVGPAPCPVARVQSRYRWRFLVRGTDAAALGRLTRRLATRYAPPGPGVRVALDRDPVSLL